MKTPRLIVDFLNPGFLKRLDRYLLLNHPRIWISKIHYVFYYGLLANIILNFLVWMFFREPSQFHLIDEFINFIIFIVMLTEVAAFVYWFLKQCLFNVAKEYGNFHFTDGIMEIVIYTVCTLIIISSSLTMTYTAIDTVAKNDANIIDATGCGLEFRELNNLLNQYNKLNTHSKSYDINIFTLEFCNTDKLKGFKKELEELSDTDEFKGLKQKLKPTISLWIKCQSKLPPNPNKKVCDESLNRCYESLSICRDIKEFITNDIDENTEKLPYDTHWWLHTIFAILGIFFLIIRKHSNWRVLSLIVLYIIILTILGIFLGIFLNSAESKLFGFIDPIFFHVDLSSSGEQISVGLIFLIILFMIFSSIQLAKKRKYSQFLYINFLSLPIAVGVLICFLSLVSSNGNIKENTWILIKFFMVYSCLVPLQKVVLNRVLSLPKE
ncbi:MAG: hypothetical protein F6K48_21870 [Okeania sp. SIO3H1]|nr:hypothetical protein [Okeania sp. SIO3H1]